MYIHESIYSMHVVHMFLYVYVCMYNYITLQKIVASNKNMLLLLLLFPFVISVMV